MTGFFSPDGKNAVAERPVSIEPSIAEGWCKDVSAPGAGDGTVLTASLRNQIIANLRNFVTGLGGAGDGSDNMLLNAALAGLLSKAIYDPTEVAGDAFDMGNMVEASDANILTDAERALLSYLTATGAIDLDWLKARVVDLDAAVVLRGAWDATSGAFPDGSATPDGVTKAGDSYVVSVAGTVDGEAFSINDRLTALVDSAATDTYAGNWLKQDYSDNWDSPAFTGTPTAPTQSAGDNSTKLATTAYVDGVAAKPAPGIVVGLQVSNMHDPADDILDIAAGFCVAEDNATVITLASAISKDVGSTFVEGDGNGGMASGESPTVYGALNVWAIRKDDGTADVLISDHATSGFSPALPSGFTKKQWIGQWYYVTAALRRGWMAGEWVYWNTPVLDVEDTSVAASHETVALTVGRGYRCEFAAILAASDPNDRLNIGMGPADLLTPYTPNTPTISSDEVAKAHMFVAVTAAATSDVHALSYAVREWTDVNGQIKYVSAAANASNLSIFTLGFHVPRGRLADFQ